VADYKSLMAERGLTSIRSADWTREISAFWPAVIKSSLRPRSVLGLLRSGWTTVRGAVAMFLMVLGYNRGLIVFGLITATKPMTKPATEGAA
jgi:tocopherol O-methyltransferase